MLNSSANFSNEFNFISIFSHLLINGKKLFLASKSFSVKSINSITSSSKLPIFSNILIALGMWPGIRIFL